MTIDAAARREGACARAHRSWVVKVDDGGLLGMAFDRSHANLDQSPVHNAWVWLARGHVEEAAKEEDCRADSRDNRENTDIGERSHWRPSLLKW